MFYVLQNESTAARRRVPILLTDAATGTTAQTGVATTTIFPYVNINGNAFIGGTGNVGEAGFGQYYYEFEVNEVATLGLAGIHITAAGCRNYDAITQVAAFNMYGAAGAGISAGDVWEYDISGISTAGTAGSQLNLSASGGAGLSAYDVWAFNYLADGVVSSSAAERLEETRIEAYAASNNTTSIPTTSDIWSFDISGNTDPSAGFNLYQLGIGATGYAAGGGISAFDVWNYTLINTQTADTTITDIQSQITSTLPTSTAASVWSYTMSNSQMTENALIAAASGATAGDVWDYVGGRTITGGIADTVTSVTNDVNVSTGSMTGIAGTVWSTDISSYVSPSAGFDLVEIASVAGFIDSSISGVPQGVWEYDISAISTAGTAGSQLNLAASPSGAGLTAGDVSNAVWDSLVISYGNTGTFGNLVLRSDAASTTGNVTLWNGASINGVYSDVYRIDEDYNAAIALKDILTGIGSSITGNITGNISGSVDSVTNPVDVSTTSMTGIAGTVWSTDISGYTSPSAGYSLYNATGGVAVTAGDIWSYATRTITGGIADTVTTVSGNVLGSVLFVVDDVTLSAGTQASIANSVWSTDVSGYTSPSAGFDVSNASSGAGISAFDVWNYTLTSSGQSADTTLGNADDQATGANTNTNSPTLEANVWSYATRTITGGIADTVTTLTNRSGFAITGGTITTVSDKTGYSLSGTQAFNLTGNITGNLSGSVGSVTNPVTFNNAQYAGIASSVWNAATRTLTSGGAGITAGDVWTYASRTLTSGAGITVNAATNIINGPYLVKSNVDGQDGTLDVIRGMVQDIQLTVTDAFQNPFDLTSLGMAVNFYDQAGSLVTSYGTTNLFAAGGLIQFTLDQVVTGNEGRYNLILSAAGSGNTIKFGPLQTLVRPF